MKLTINVEGMTCKHCEMAVEKAIKNLQGIQNVQASHKEKNVKIEYNNPNLKIEDFYNVIEETGYIPIKN